MRARLTGQHPIMLRYTDGNDNNVTVSVGSDTVLIGGVIFPVWMLNGLIELASGNHTMSDCVWAECPEHACPFDHSHTRNWCGRPTCRES